MKYLFLTILASAILFLSCNNQNANRMDAKSKESKTQDSAQIINNEGQYSVQVDLEMTLSEVAKQNSISLNYLKSQLGIPASLKHDYQLKTISKNFKFTEDDIVRIINQYHSKSVGVKTN
ncbi:MAG: hypothetical protein C0598_07230 [Marinilabiliales bacterium]|nr:MAG: hypothetical protein C0598_07230 [Marinilabiliales bacterium]